MTYAVRGLMEWRVNIPTGSAVPYIPVLFEGGQVSGYGVTPARFTTDDPELARMIEATHWYKSGRIYRLK